MNGPRLKDLPVGVKRRLARMPMSDLEAQDVSGIPGRCSLKPNEAWSAIAYVNNRYHVQVSVVQTAIGEVLHLWIGRVDHEMPRSWRDLQWLKNEIAGFDRTAVEVFPAESELVDQAPLAHLWVYPADFVMPFTLGGGR